MPSEGVSSLEVRVSSGCMDTFASIAPTLLLRKNIGRPASLPSFRFAQGWGTQRGMWVVLLGPDGVGKSSVIEGIGSGRAAGFAECESYHLRPMAAWRRRAPRANCDPHGRSPRGMMMSVLKLIYLLAANWLGYLATLKPRLAQEKLILFDRYFPDCLVDPRRYRLPESCYRMSELIARLLPEPDLYVVLDAPASVLQLRKCEVTLAESQRQRQEYVTHMTSLANVVVVDAARPLAEVVDEVVNCIIEQRLAQCRKVYKVA